MIVWPGLRRFISTVQRLFNSASFYAPLTHSLVLDRGTGSPTFTRATAATVLGYGPTANSGDSQTLLTVAANEARFVGARRISEGVWSDTFADGTPIPSSTLLGYLAEGARTNHFLQSGTPATQTSGALSTGTYTLWMDGTGSIAVAGATATITGAGTATSSTAVTFVVTVAGTVTYTVTGSPTRAQSENGAQRSSYIPTTTLAVARNADVLSYSGVSDLVTLASIGFTPPATAVAGTNFTLMSLQDSSVVSNSVIMRVNGSTLKPELVTFSGSVLQVAETHTSALTNAPHKFIASVATNNTFSVIDGGDVKVDTSCTAPSGVTTLYIGSYPSDQWFNGNIKWIYGWTRNLSQAEAKAVTV